MVVLKSLAVKTDSVQKLLAFLFFGHFEDDQKVIVIENEIGQLISPRTLLLTMRSSMSLRKLLLTARSLMMLNINICHETIEVIQEAIAYDKDVSDIIQKEEIYWIFLCCLHHSTITYYFGLLRADIVITLTYH